MTGEWLKKVVFCMCFLELIYQLVPKKMWQKYLKFTGGLIFILIFLEPVLQLFDGRERIQDIVWNWQIQESAASLREEQRELAELQNNQIRKEASRKLEEQITLQIRRWGGEAERVDVTIADQAESIEKVEIVLKQNVTNEKACREELQAYWGLQAQQIIIRHKGAESI